MKLNRHKIESIIKYLEPYENVNSIIEFYHPTVLIKYLQNIIPIEYKWGSRVLAEDENGHQLNALYLAETGTQYKVLTEIDNKIIYVNIIKPAVNTN